MDKEGQTVDTACRRRTAGKGRRTARGTGSSAGKGGKDRRRLVQLVVSLALFLLVFVGRGVFPRQIQAWKQIVASDTDFKAAFQAFGHAIAEGSTVNTALEKLWAAVLGGGQPAPDEVPELQPPQIKALSQTSRLGLDYLSSHGMLSDCKAPAETVPPETEPTPEPSPEIVTAVAQEYTTDGVKLPSNVSFAYYELGLEETAVPVYGSVTSDFGYRTSPITGEREFHLALDIAAAEGTGIGAFADGTVEYIGESDEFGLYLKIAHANGVSSFYAHCSKLLVRKGDVVTCGQTVALVGHTGNATGDHLHLTIEKDNIRLDPAYYVDLS